jgi:hypothetical protein
MQLAFPDLKVSQNKMHEDDLEDFCGVYYTGPKQVR